MNAGCEHPEGRNLTTTTRLHVGLIPYRLIGHNLFLGIFMGFLGLVRYGARSVGYVALHCACQWKTFVGSARYVADTEQQWLIQD